VKIDGFDWDSGNLLKNEVKHSLTHEVIEAFFREKIWVAPDPLHSVMEDRFLAIGSGPGKRPMIVAFTFRNKGNLRLIRPISARFMHMKEVKKYEEAFAKNED
jgi:uncharacterized DUF497 family protein